MHLNRWPALYMGTQLPLFPRCSTTVCCLFLTASSRLHALGSLLLQPQILPASSPLQWYFSPVPHLFGVGFNFRASLVLQLSRSWCYLSGFTRSSWPRAPACIVIEINRFCCEFVRLRSGFNPCIFSLFPRCSPC